MTNAKRYDIIYTSKERNGIKAVKVKTMRYAVIMIVDNAEYTYGTWDNPNKANEVAMEVRDFRGIDVYVREVE